jgi:hypothetical protein
MRCGIALKVPFSELHKTFLDSRPFCAEFDASAVPTTLICRALVKADK